QVVTTETVLGAVCVYLLIGFSFAFIYLAAAFLSSTPFFVGQSSTATSEYLFFSYTTLTTVGYGNLVPAGHGGAAVPIVEALFGQIFLVIVVARLVSLWGQAGPRASARTVAGSAGDDSQRDQHSTDQQADERAADIANQDVRY